MWLVFAIASAAAKSVSNVARKKALNSSSPLAVVYLMRIFSMPIVAAVGLATSGLDFAGMADIAPLLIAIGVIETVATIYSFRSMHIDDISRVVPIQAFLPIFLLIFASVSQTDVPPLLGIIGVIVVVIGLYAMSFKKAAPLLQPFVLLWRSPGTRLMLYYTFLSAIVVFLEKRALGTLNPASLLLSILAVQVIALSPFVRRKRLKLGQELKMLRRPMLVIVVATAISQISLLYAVDATFASYAFAVRNTDIFMSVILGWLLLGERVEKRHLGAASIVTMGVIILGLS